MLFQTAARHTTRKGTFVVCFDLKNVMHETSVIICYRGFDLITFWKCIWQCFRDKVIAESFMVSVGISSSVGRHCLSEIKEGKA